MYFHQILVIFFFHFWTIQLYIYIYIYILHVCVIDRYFSNIIWNKVALYFVIVDVCVFSTTVR